MLLVTMANGHVAAFEQVQASAPKAGRAYGVICLGSDDFAYLASLPPQGLKEWLDLWRLGFIPDSPGGASPEPR